MLAADEVGATVHEFIFYCWLSVGFGLDGVVLSLFGQYGGGLLAPIGERVGVSFFIGVIDLFPVLLI